MKIAGVIFAFVAVGSLAARCNSDGLVENPKTASSENIAADGGNGSSDSTDSSKVEDSNPTAGATPESVRTDSDNTVNGAGFDPDDPEDAQIAREVNEILSDGREVFRQECHDYGPKAVPYLLVLLERHIKNQSNPGHAVMCLGAVGNERAVEPIIAAIENEKISGGSLSYLLQSLGYLAAQGNERAYQYLTDNVQPENWAKNDRPGYIVVVFWALAKSNRKDAHLVLTQILESIEKKIRSKETLSPMENRLMTFSGPEGDLARTIREIRLSGIFGFYNSEIRKQKGISAGSGQSVE